MAALDYSEKYGTSLWEQFKSFIKALFKRK